MSLISLYCSTGTCEDAISSLGLRWRGAPFRGTDHSNTGLRCNCYRLKSLADQMDKIRELRKCKTSSEELSNSFCIRLEQTSPRTKFVTAKSRLRYGGRCPRARLPSSPNRDRP